MANSTTNLDLIDQAQAQHEVTANALFDAFSPGGAFGRRASTCVGLTWGYFGGTILPAGAPTEIANGTVTLTPSATNYLTVDASGVIAVTTSTPSGWPGPLSGSLIALYEIVVGANAPTSWKDWRGWWGAAGAAGSEGPTGPTGPEGPEGPTGPAGADGGSLVALNSQTGTTYTLVLTDAGLCVEMNNASPNTLTVPTNASVAFPIGTNVLVRQMGAGLTTIAGAGGVTVRTPLTLVLKGQYCTAALHKRDTDEWCLDGNIT